jgi:hypothetical protein
MIVLEKDDRSEDLIIIVVATVVEIEADITTGTIEGRMLRLFVLSVGRIRLCRLSRLRVGSQFCVGIVLELVNN